MGWVSERPTPTAASQLRGLPLCPLSRMGWWDPGGSDLRELTVPPRICSGTPPRPAQGPDGLLGPRPLYCPTRLLSRSSVAGRRSEDGDQSFPQGWAEPRAGPPHTLTLPSHKQGPRVTGDLIPGQTSPSGGPSAPLPWPRKRWLGSFRGPAAASLLRAV